MEDSPNPTPSLSELETAKISARQALLAQNPKEAQAIANQTLYPQLWTLADPPVWEERLPRVSKSFNETQPQK
jgi:hypothetical protein